MDSETYQKLSEIVRLLLDTERLADDNKMRLRLLDQQVERVVSWKHGVYRA